MVFEDSAEVAEDERKSWCFGGFKDLTIEFRRCTGFCGKKKRRKKKEKKKNKNIQNINRIEY